MARQTKDEITNQLDAAVLRANRVTLDLAKLRAGIGAAIELAGEGHLNLGGLIDEIDRLLSERSQPSEVEQAYPLFEPGEL